MRVALVGVVGKLVGVRKEFFGGWEGRRVNKIYIGLDGLLSYGI